MKILHINSYYSTSGLFKQLYDRQTQAGLDIDVYVPISYQYPQDRVAATGEYTHISRNHNKFERYVFHWKHRSILKDLTTHYAIEDYDIVHAHSLFSNGWLAHQLWKKYRKPYVVAVRNTDVRTFFAKMPWLRHMGLEILEHAAHVIFISQNSYDEVFTHYIPQSLRTTLKDKTTILPNGIDDFWHENAYNDKAPEFHKPIRIVTAGKVVTGKRFVQLAEMIQSYSDNIHPAELHIVGPAWTPRIVEQLGKMRNVYYYGPHKKEDILKLYRQMDIFALLSYPETFGLVYPEAMSQGLPVIYTQYEGFDSFFDNHTVGVSVEKSDQIGFNKAIDYILKHYDRLMQNALAGSETFNWNRITEHYLNLYETINANHRV
ncbi:MAG: glycosyltransferase family 4 protein [Aerococcaceae bacterium]|nr:glycosyltransferase family 4 protein [Aerococcaceae bacterium]